MQTFILPKGKESLRECLNKLPNSIRWRVVVEEYKPKRSTEANAYLWAAIITPLADHCGYTPEEMHELLLAQIYGTKQIKWGERTVEVPNKRTSDMNKQEFSDHILKCQAIASDLGVRVEQPEWEVEIL